MNTAALKAARGLEKAELVLKNCRVVNVFTGEIEDADVAIHGGVIVGVGKEYQGVREFDVGHYLVTPGLIDAHMHVESTMMAPSVLGDALIHEGTTTVFADPHEIVNVLGQEGFWYMVRNAEHAPVEFRFLVPSCVPASKLSTGGSDLSAEVADRLLQSVRSHGLAEVMDFPAVLRGDDEVHDKIRSALDEEKPVDGHAPGLSGKDLNAYILSGPRSDHECTSMAEAREKIRRGMHVFIREGSVTKNLGALHSLALPGWNDSLLVASLSLCTDDLLPWDIVHRGHMNHLVKRLTKHGVPLASAIRMATLNTARFFGVPDIGAIAPGYRADIVVWGSDLGSEDVPWTPAHVLRSGKFVIRGYQKTGDRPSPVVFSAPRKYELPPTLNERDFVYQGPPDTEWDKLMVIRALPGSAGSGRTWIEPHYDDYGTWTEIHQRPGDDCDEAKLAVMGRHFPGQGRGIALVVGLGLREGAIASTVCHDHHNLIVAGADDESMVTAANQALRLGGGLVVAKGKEVVASLPLPVAGLMSDSTDIQWVSKTMERVNHAAMALGCEDNVFMTLSFLGLEVIPELKLTDRGLVDVNKAELVSPFVKE